VASFGLFVGTRRDPRTSGLGVANVWRYASTDLEAEYAPVLRGELPSAASCFVSSPSAKGALELDASNEAPRHTVVLVALVPFAPFAKWADTRALRRGEDYERLKETLADRYRSALEAIAPGVLEGADVIEAATPLTNHAFALARDGGAYGPAHTPDQMGPSRFDATSPVPGLFLAGASAAYAGVVACALSGFEAGTRAVEASRKRARSLSGPAIT
jgi:all-trans-retinol 13,14-reductase